MPGALGTIPTQFRVVSMGSLTPHIPYIPNQAFIFQQFVYNLPTNTPVPNTVNPTLQIVDPNSNLSQQNIGIGDCEAHFSHGSTRPKIYLMSDGNR